MSLSLLIPLNTLEKYDPHQSSNSQVNITETLITLSQLDVNSLEEKDLIPTLDYWCKILSQVKFGIATSPITVTNQIIIAVITLAEATLLLHIRLRENKEYSLKPIYAYLWSNDDLFDQSDPPSRYPIRPLKPIESHLMLLNYIQNIYKDKIKFDCQALFSIAIEIAARSHKINLSEISEYTSMYTKLQDITQESLTASDLTPVLQNFNNFNSIEYLTVVFIYESLFDCQIPTLLTIPNLFSRIVQLTSEKPEESNSYLPLLALYSSDPVPYSKNISFPINYGLFCRKAMIINEEILFNLKEDSDINSILLYALYLNTTQDVIERFFQQTFSETMKGPVANAKELLGLSESIDQLIQGCHQDKSAAAKRLYQMKLPNSRFDCQYCELLEIIKILHSDEVDFSDPAKIDRYSHVRLIRLIELGKAPPVEFINEMVKNIHKSLLENTPKEMFSVMMCNCTPPKYDKPHLDIAFPTTIEDFITVLPFRPYVAYSFFIYLAFSFYGRPSTDEMIDIYIDLSLHLLLNSANRSYLRDFLLGEMPSNFGEKRNQKRKEYALKAIESEDNRIETLKAISVVFDDSDTIIETIQFLLKNNDGKSLCELYQLNSKVPQAILTKFSTDVQLTILDVFINQDSSVVIAYMHLLLSAYINPNEDEYNKDKSCLLQILCKRALEHPKIISSLFSVLQLDAPTAGEIINILPQFSGDISPKFAHLLQSLLSLLPLYPVELKTEPTIRPHIETAWEDDESTGREDKDAKTNQPIDIWHFHGKPQNCLKDDIGEKAFFCYTCNPNNTTNNPICQNCAELCHMGHDLVLACSATFLSNCACGSKCIACGNHDSFPDLPQEEKTASNLFDSAILNMFLNLSKSKIGIHQLSNELLSSLTTNSNLPIDDIDLSTFQASSSLYPFSYRFIPLSDTCKILNVGDFISNAANENNTHFTRRIAISPFHLMELAGPVSENLIVCCGNKLYSYEFSLTPEKENPSTNSPEPPNPPEQTANSNEQQTRSSIGGIIDPNSFKQLHQFNIDHNGLQMAIFPIDPSVIAVASLHHVSVLTVNHNGSFAHTTDIELMLDDLGSEIFVNSISWVPNQMMFLAVVCNTFVKIYDILTDSFSPVAYYVPPNDTFFSSVKFISYNENSYALFGLSSGRIAIREVCGTANDTSPEGIRTTNYIEFPHKISQMPIISVSEEGDLIFISSYNDKSIHTIRISALIDKVYGDGNNKQLNMYNIDLGPDRKVYSFVFIGNNGTTHYFENPFTGALLSVDFNTQTSSFDVSYLNKEIENSSTSCLFEGKMKSLSNILINSILYSISPKSGKLTYMLRSLSADEEEEENEVNNTKTENEDNEIDDENIVFSDDSESEPNLDLSENDSENITLPPENENITVPASFWLNSQIATQDINITSPHCDGDLNRLLSGSRYIFYNGLKHKNILIQSTNPNQLIVGFRLTLGQPPHRSPWIKINGRKQTTTPHRSFMLPLKPSEVKPKAINKIELGGNGSLDINCDYLDAFVIDKSAFPKNYDYLTTQYDWFNFGTSLFDFVDKKVSTKKIRSQKSNKLLDLMNICSYALGGNNPNFNLNEQQLREVIRIMYTRPNATEMSRRIIVKLVKDKEKATAIWANEIMKMIDEKAIAKEAWALLWRDLSLLPPQFLDEISSRIWSTENIVDGAFPVITAFMTK